jgi:AraC-like DNA-binding protein
MNLNNVAGASVRYCQARERQRHYYSMREASQASTLLLITEGRARFNFNGRHVTAQRNDILCWDPGELEDFHHAGGVPISFITLVFDIIALDGRKLKLLDIGVPRRMSLGKSGAVRGLLGRIRNVFNTRDPLRQFQCSRLGLELLQRLDKDSQPARTPPSDPDTVLHHRIRDALEYVYFNYKKRLEVAGLARKACMSADYFTRLFKRQVGVSPSQYVLEFKIRKAMDFLGTYDEPLAFTGEELGFHDYSHFSRTFKKITGLSPRRFVKKGKKGYDPKQDEWNL